MSGEAKHTTYRHGKPIEGLGTFPRPIRTQEQIEQTDMAARLEERDALLRELANRLRDYADCDEIIFAKPRYWADRIDRVLADKEPTRG